MQGEWWVDGAYRIVLFYRYCRIDAVNVLEKHLLELCTSLEMLGRVLIASEGINGTLAAPRDKMDAFILNLSSDERFRFALVDWKFSDVSAATHSIRPFPNLSIRKVAQIISVGTPDVVIPTNFDETTFGGLVGTGTHLKPKQFHEAILLARELQDPNVYIIDVRNVFESDIGRFDGALPIGTNTYAETWVNLDQILGLRDCRPLNRKKQRAQMRESRKLQRVGVGVGVVDGRHTARKDCVAVAIATTDLTTNIAEEEEKNEDDVPASVSTETATATGAEKTVFMYCTGGIRCEKASAYLLNKGIGRVFQLEGGIHRYLEEYGARPVQSAVPSTATDTSGESVSSPLAASVSLFVGKNYVFDSAHDEEAGRGCFDHRDLGSIAAVATAAIGATTGTMTLGKCVCCHDPHDLYNGHIACCVCRLPILVCDKCVARNVNTRSSGDFHCTKHAYLKDCYFSRLHRYDKNELQHQLVKLGAFPNKSCVKKQISKVKNCMLLIENKVQGNCCPTPSPADAAAVGSNPPTQTNQVHYWVKMLQNEPRKG